MLELKPDVERTMERMEAFWEREILDRPLVQYTVARPPEEQVPVPESHHATPDERWLDVDYQTRLRVANLSNRYYPADQLPAAYPNLGPEIFSALYGCPIHFGDYGTSWTDPILDDWAQADDLRLNWESPYLRTLHEMTDALLEAGRGRFITGMADWHPGGDAVAAFRDPQNLAVDLITHPEEVKALLGRLEADYFTVYDVFYDKLRAAGQPITTWLPLASDGRYYVPSNDFSCMISEAMFAEFFYQGIVNECRFLDRSIYHLDGPNALRHLDALMAIPELDALQWVPGAGNEGFVRWIDVYRRAQAAGKGLWISCGLDEVPDVMAALDSHGVCLAVHGVPTLEAGEELLRRAEDWCTGRLHAA
ncbi:MAG: hypothetical protein GX649_13545 [Chloroflexi bacterium]|nr:hypothetical protein [Chloroflexota bacterium]